MTKSYFYFYCGISLKGGVSILADSLNGGVSILADNLNGGVSILADNLNSIGSKDAPTTFYIGSKDDPNTFFIGNKEILNLVRIAGLEPARVTPLPPQSSASANSAICAPDYLYLKQLRHFASGIFKILLYFFSIVFTLGKPATG